ncbi:hypothetical protein RCL1_002698 [Eukaryota sp. TZLM3-RCL]
MYRASCSIAAIVSTLTLIYSGLKTTTTDPDLSPGELQVISKSHINYPQSLVFVLGSTLAISLHSFCSLYMYEIVNKECHILQCITGKRSLPLLSNRTFLFFTLVILPLIGNLNFPLLAVYSLENAFVEHWVVAAVFALCATMEMVTITAVLHTNLEQIDELAVANKLSPSFEMTTLSSIPSISFKWFSALLCALGIGSYFYFRRPCFTNQNLCYYYVGGQYLSVIAIFLFRLSFLKEMTPKLYQLQTGRSSIPVISPSAYP